MQLSIGREFGLALGLGTVLLFAGGAYAQTSPVVTNNPSPPMTASGGEATQVPSLFYTPGPNTPRPPHGNAFSFTLTQTDQDTVYETIAGIATPVLRNDPGCGMRLLDSQTLFGLQPAVWAGSNSSGVNSWTVIGYGPVFVQGTPVMKVSKHYRYEAFNDKDTSLAVDVSVPFTKSFLYDTTWAPSGL